MCFLYPLFNYSLPIKKKSECNLHCKLKQDDNLNMQKLDFSNSQVHRNLFLFNRFMSN